MFWFNFNWQIQHFLNQFWWPINFLLLVILVVIGYLAYKKPLLAVNLTIILLPTYLFRSKIWFLPFTFLELCIWLTFFGWLIKSLREKKLNPSEKYFYKWPILLILVASTISVFIGPDLQAAAGLWRAYFIEPILFFLVLTNVTNDQKSKESVLWSLGISTLIISFLGIYQKFSGFGIAQPIWLGADHRRITSIFTSPNAVGLYLGPIVVVYLSWLIAKIKNWRQTILKLLIIIPASLAIIFTISQGAWLGLLVAIIFLAYFACPTEAGQGGGWNKKITTTVILAAILGILIIPQIRQQVLPIVTFQDAAGQNRLELLQISHQYLLAGPKNFVFGTGIYGFNQLHEQFRDPLKTEPLIYPHNIILNFWLEIGLLGLIAFSWLITKLFKSGFKKLKIKKSWLTLGLMAAMITVLVHGLVDVPYFKNDLAVLFWIIVGLLS